MQMSLIFGKQNQILSECCFKFGASLEMKKRMQCPAQSVEWHQWDFVIKLAFIFSDIEFYLCLKNTLLVHFMAKRHLCNVLPLFSAVSISHSQLQK